MYEDRHERTIYAAEAVLSSVQRVVPEITSAVDLGCGVGTWLHVLKQRGATELCGVDGGWVSKEHLKIRTDEFIEHDLSTDTWLDIDRAFDLAISLEVAEHLPYNSSGKFVELLTKLSDFVLFSAAIPGQGGVNHINEQWPNFWISLFENRDFVCFDVIRKNLWNDEAIPLWYRQNALLFARSNRVVDLKFEGSPGDHIPPEKYLLLFTRAVVDPGIKRSLRALLSAVKRRITRMIRADKRADRSA
jgi:SAM-dependent methyltransferase